MALTPEQRYNITQELLSETGGRLDGGRRNIIADCPWCGRTTKFGIYIGQETKYKTFGSCNCFVCNHNARTLKGTLEILDRLDLLPKETTSLEDSEVSEIELDFEDEIDDELKEIEMPSGYKRCFKNPYLKSRGWNADDYEYYPVGTTRGINPKFNDYVILEVLDGGKRVGYVARNILSKEEIDEYNNKHHFKIMRYKNSHGEEFNGFSKILYGIDSIKIGETLSVVLCEGPFDVVALNRKLEWYDSPWIKAIGTFGKKISQTQIYKLQSMGIESVVIGYDADAKETIAQVAAELEKYFDVLIADIPENWKVKDFDEMDEEQIYDLFTDHLVTLREFNLL